MKIVAIEREVAHKLNVAKFESIVPTLRMRAELDPGENPVEAEKALNAVLTAEWNKIALEELRLVHKRRQGKVIENDDVPALMAHFKSELQK